MKRNMDEYDFCKRYGVSISRIRSGPNFDRKKALFEVTKKINKVLNTKNIVNNDEKFLNQFGIYSVSVMYEYSIQFDDAYLVLTNKGYAIVNNEFMKSLLAKIVLNECEIDAQNIRDNFGISLSKNQISFLTHLSLDG